MSTQGNPGIGTCVTCGTQYRCEAKINMEFRRLESVTGPCPQCGDHYLRAHRGDTESFTIK